MGRRVADFRSGEALTKDRLNQLVDGVNRLSQVSGGTGVDAATFDSGVQLSSPVRVPYDLVELKTNVPFGTSDAEVNVLRRDFSAPGGSDPFVQQGETAGRLIDHGGGPWLAGSRVVSLWLPNAEQRIAIPTFQWHIGRLAETLTSGGTASVSIWTTDIGGSHADSGLAVTAYDWMLPAGKSLAADESVVLLQHIASGRWYVVRSIHADTAIVRFKLTSSLSLGGSATAVTRNWNGSAYVDGATITVNDFSGGRFQGAVGDEGMTAELSDRPGVHEILWIEESLPPPSGTSLIRFELTSQLEPGGSANAQEVAWTNGT